MTKTQSIKKSIYQNISKFFSFKALITKPYIYYRSGANIKATNLANSLIQMKSLH